MGERHDAEHSVAQARQRLSAIAEELSRRASGDYVKARAMEATDHFKERAKMRARVRTYEMRDRMLDSPWALGLIGGVVGAIAGKLLGGRARERYLGHEEYVSRPSAPHYYGSYGYDEYDRPYDEYTATHGSQESLLITDDASLGGGDMRQGVRGADFGMEDLGGEERGEGLKAKAAGAIGAAKERVGDVSARAADRAREMASRAKERIPHVRERLPSREELRSHLPTRESFRHGAAAVRHNSEEHPELWALGALVAGAIFGAMTPVTERERRAFAPAKSRAHSGLEALKSEAIGKVENLKENARAVASGMMSELKSDDSQADSGANADRGAAQAWQPPAQTPEWKASGEDQSGGGLVGGYGADSGADQTTGIGYGEEKPGGGSFHAGGSDDDKDRIGWSAGSDPDVTRH